MNRPPSELHCTCRFTTIAPPSLGRLGALITLISCLVSCETGLSVFGFKAGKQNSLIHVYQTTAIPYSISHRSERSHFHIRFHRSSIHECPLTGFQTDTNVYTDHYTGVKASEPRLQIMPRLDHDVGRRCSDIIETSSLILPTALEERVGLDSFHLIPHSLYDETKLLFEIFGSRTLDAMLPCRVDSLGNLLELLPPPGKSLCLMAHAHAQPSGRKPRCSKADHHF